MGPRHSRASILIPAWTLCGLPAVAEGEAQNSTVGPNRQAAARFCIIWRQFEPEFHNTGKMMG